MATFRHQKRLCSHPHQLEARLLELHLHWAAEQQALEAAEQSLAHLQRHQAQLHWVMRDETAPPARVVVTKLTQVEEQIAQTQRRLADQRERCHQIASQFEAVQVALGVARRQTRKPRWTWSGSQRMGRLLTRLTRLALQGLQCAARSEGEWWPHGWYGW
jgi:uncharacterized coiled-coil protein SlyX